MRFSRRHPIVAALIGGTACLLASPAVAGDGAPRRVYCFAFALGESDKLLRAFSQPTLYVTPLFESDDAEPLLEVMYRQSLPDAGLATCVTEDDEPDIEASRQQLIDGSKIEGAPVAIVPLVED